MFMDFQQGYFKNNKICKKLNIKVLEDCSESIGSKIGNKKIGKFGDISIFSIRSGKMIGVGEGVIMSSDNKIFNDLKLICSRHYPLDLKRPLLEEVFLQWRRL